MWYVFRGLLDADFLEIDVFAGLVVHDEFSFGPVAGAFIGGAGGQGRERLRVHFLKDLESTGLTHLGDHLHQRRHATDAHHHSFDGGQLADAGRFEFSQNRVIRSLSLTRHYEELLTSHQQRRQCQPLLLQGRVVDRFSVCILGVSLQRILSLQVLVALTVFLLHFLESLTSVNLIESGHVDSVACEVLPVQVQTLVSLDGLHYVVGNPRENLSVSLGVFLDHIRELCLLLSVEEELQVV